MVELEELVPPYVARMARGFSRWNLTQWLEDIGRAIVGNDDNDGKVAVETLVFG